MLALASSVYAARLAGQLRADEEARAAAAAQALERSRALHRDAMGFLGVPSPAEPLAVALARAALSLRSGAAPLGVTLSEVSVEGAGGVFDAAEISAIARPLAFAPGVKRAAVTVKGTYRRLGGLREYVAGAARGQSALAAFSASGDRFEATFHVFGR